MARGGGGVSEGKSGGGGTEEKEGREASRQLGEELEGRGARKGWGVGGRGVG